MTAVSNNTAYANVVYSELFEAVLDQISMYSVTVTPVIANYTYPFGQTITVTVNLPEAVALDHIGW